MPNMISFLCLFLEMLFFISYIVIWENLNADFIHQNNKINEVVVLCFGKCSDAESGRKMT